MKKVIFCIATIMIAGCAQSCTKLNEDQYDEHIERPQIDIEVPPPTWESTPEIDNELNFEITPH
ncbi:MAG: hypothetical protein SNI87_07135 [Rikenellaceae bacterium]